MTTAGLVAGIALREPVLVGAVAVVLATAVLSGWRLNLYAALWRRVMVPLVGQPAEREPAAPHRFATLLGATFTALGTLALSADLVLSPDAVAAGLSGLEVVGYGLSALVAALAGLAAATDICVGCRLYRQVSYVRRFGVV